MHTDLTFFTNEPGSTLLDRFKRTLKDVRYFDILVGYFRSSGFFHLYQSFEHIEKIRILVGLSIDKKTYQIIETVRQKEFDVASQKQIENLVDKILEIKKQDPKTNTSSREKQIDVMVYHLYNLIPIFIGTKIIDAALTEEEFEKYKM